MKVLIVFILSHLLNLSSYTEDCKGEVKDGKKVGIWKCFYEDGKVMQEGPYVNNLKNGHWKFFHHNGKVALEGDYVNDAEKGQWKVYDEDGKQMDVIEYGG